MSKKWTREKIFLPKTIKPKERKQIAEVIINHIITRSAAGYDRNNEKFADYTEKYAEKKGVKVGDVDLILTGEMLESLELVSQRNGEIVIGYKEPSDELAGKIEGNRSGSYGGEPDDKRARDFLGIDQDELDLILSSYRQETESLNIDQLTEEEIKVLSAQLSSDILEDL